MNISNADSNSLEHRLENLRTQLRATSKQQIFSRVSQQIRAEKRQVFSSLLGFCISVIAAIIFVSQNDPFGSFALPLIALVFLSSAFYSSKRNNNLANNSSSDDFLNIWKIELRKKIREIKFIGPLATIPFAALTAFVIYTHGIVNVKSSLYLATCSAIFIYVCYQILVILPQVISELNSIDELSAE